MGDAARGAALSRLLGSSAADPYGGDGVALMCWSVVPAPSVAGSRLQYGLFRLSSTHQEEQRIVIMLSAPLIKTS